ncbi:MAG: beta galactosidase jelly roll domain-containing protein [Clostridiales bacterium]|nr:beta galactosidase jelly roll domain-containing protein [Clostridiales bacterium]
MSIIDKNGAGIPRPEHPRPQFVRGTWMNLNGKWDFLFDFGNSGRDRQLWKDEAFDEAAARSVMPTEITVPFCPESRLSGIGYTDWIDAVWYRRTFVLDAGQTAGRAMLRFGAVDYHAVVWVNGEKAGEHVGGYSSFAFDVTALVRTGENTVVVYAEDDNRSGIQPHGKQSTRYQSYACSYTRTTGIWQTVWLEFVPKDYIKSVRYYPDVENCAVTVVADVCGSGVLNTRITYNGQDMGSAEVKASGQVSFTVPLAEKHLWEIGKGRLYDVKFTFGEDEVKSYFGLRSVKIDGYKFLLNGKSVFQRLVLDQGFYPDGIYTAPSDRDLKEDIERSMRFGFNGARLHEKVFEARFLYYCDKLGYIVWGEYPNWGIDPSRQDLIPQYTREWTESVERDFNHPSIIGWCPFNETWDFEGRIRCPELLRTVYEITKKIDPTRPCIDTSGNYHVVTDIFDVHDYTQSAEALKEHCELMLNEHKSHDRDMNAKQTYTGGAFFVSEYGGIGWDCNAEKGWSYGEAPKTEEEFKNRFKALADVLLDDDRIMGLCYTQLTDVEQEVNGLYTYDRRAKFDSEFFHDALSRKAAIED